MRVLCVHHTLGYTFKFLRGVYSDTTPLNSTVPVEQRTAKSVVFLFMTSRPTNWVNWVTTFIDRPELSSVEFSCVAINGPLVCYRNQRGRATDSQRQRVPKRRAGRGEAAWSTSRQPTARNRQIMMSSCWAEMLTTGCGRHGNARVCQVRRRRTTKPLPSKSAAVQSVVHWTVITTVQVYSDSLKKFTSGLQAHRSADNCLAAMFLV